jgi:putative Holliday junction resolvase
VIGRILGIDYGDRRVGFAVSDPTQMLATAREVVLVQAPGHAANEAARIAGEVGAVRIVVGHPINMDGSRGPAAQKATAFVELLRAKVSVPIDLWDERLSTKSAHDALIEGGMDGRERRHVVDKMAAQILLQAYLDRQAYQRESAAP